MLWQSRFCQCWHIWKRAERLWLVTASACSFRALMFGTAAPIDVNAI